eukprot:6719778-Prymnesium_polylepis.1
MRTHAHAWVGLMLRFSRVVLPDCNDHEFGQTNLHEIPSMRMLRLAVDNEKQTRTSMRAPWPRAWLPAMGSNI